MICVCPNYSTPTSTKLTDIQIQTPLDKAKTTSKSKNIQQITVPQVQNTSNSFPKLIQFAKQLKFNVLLATQIQSNAISKLMKTDTEAL